MLVKINPIILKVLKLGYRQVVLAEWLRRVPTKYMGFPRESSNLSGDEFFTLKMYKNT